MGGAQLDEPDGQQLYINVMAAPSPSIEAQYNNTGCAPFLPPTVASISVGSFLIFGSCIMALPMIFNMIRTQSSRGVSCLTLCLTLAFTAANAGSTIMIKWPQLVACRDGFGGVAQLLDLGQMFVSGIMWLVTFFTLARFPPHSHVRYTGLAAAMLVAMFGTWGLCAALSAMAPCEDSTLAIAKGVSTAGSIFAAIQYIPQFVETCRERGSGSLSYITYTLCTSGSAGIMFNQAVLNQDPWAVWLPLAASFVTQGAVLCTALAFDLRAWRLRRADTAILNADSAAALARDSSTLEAPLNRS